MVLWFGCNSKCAFWEPTLRHSDTSTELSFVAHRDLGSKMFCSLNIVIICVSQTILDRQEAD